MKDMWKTALLLALLAFAGWGAVEPEPGFVIVTGDRVSLRAEPDLHAVLLGRAMTGDRFDLSDASHPEWVGVRAPESVDVWVNEVYVKDGVVQADRLNIRSGPSLSHSIIGVVEAGAVLTIRGKVADWLQIAPTPECTVWISRDFADVTLPKPIEPIEPPEVPVEIEEAPEVLPETAGPTVYQVLAAARVLTEETRDSLRPDPEKEQGLQARFSGILQPAGGFLYRLDNPVDGTVRCYVRGNVRQMETFSRLPLEISGKIYWAEGIDLPLIVPSVIKKLEETRHLE